MKLHDNLLAAEDCTQDVFYLLIKKSGELDLKHNIRGWLYATADRLVKEYQKQKAKRDQFQSYESEMVEQPVEEETHYPIFDVLTKEEYDLISRYYSLDKDEREELAHSLGISVNALYKRIHDIKQKVRNAQNGSE